MPSGNRLLIALLAVGVVVILVVVFWVQRPNLYGPARTALSETQVHFYQALTHEKNFNEEARLARRELQKTIEYLQKVEQLDPEDRQKIDELRGQLLEMEDSSSVASMSEEELKQRYDRIMTEIKVLMNKLSGHNS